VSLRATGPAIWMYWESPGGVGRPPYLDACEATIRIHAGRLPVIVMNEHDVAEVAGPVPAAWDLMSAVQRADWTRVRVVHRHGGIWVDADTVAMQPLGQLLELLSPARSFVGYGSDGVHNGLFAGLPGSELLGEWSQQQELILRDADPRELAWTALGSSIAEPIATGFDWVRLDHRRIAPIDWRDWELLLSRTYPVAKVLEQDPITVMLYNAQMASHLRSVGVPQLVGGLTLTGRVLRRALGLGPRPMAVLSEALDPVGRLARRLRARRRHRGRPHGAPA
jgi:hypothetical protein